MAPRLKRTSTLDLEAQLAGVLEQDGITMVSAEGVRRRARRPRASAKTTPSERPVIFLHEDVPDVIEDRIANLDVATVGLMVRSSETNRERTIAIHAEERPRSAYVLSLRGLMVRQGVERTDERMPLHEAYGDDHEPEARANEVAVYGTLTQDLAVDAYETHVFTEQFTPREFALAYTQVYGGFDRITSALRNVTEDISGLFQRVERVERHVEDTAEEVMQIVDIPRLSLVRTLAGFVALLLVVTLPANAVAVYRSAMETRDAAEGAGNAAVGELLSADVSSLPSTAESLKRASGKFREADAALTQSSALAVGIASVLPRQYRSARALLEVGDKSSQAGRLLSLAFEKVFSDPGRGLDERLDVLGAYARAAIPLLTDAAKAAATVDPESLPEDTREAFTKLAAGLEDGTQSVRDFAVMADLLAALSGKDRPRTFLLVFQNNTELRPTGGFMGSVAEVVFDGGEIKKMRVPPGGTYDLKGQLLSHVISPQPLHLINAHWQFQDANWFPDFPTSAEKIRWFWSKSGQPTLDGVIAINASFVEQLLDITGPIDMPEYGKVIDRSNFLIETQKSVEIEYDRVANMPKKFVGDLADAMRERMKTFTSEDWLAVAALVSEGMETKEIQVALMDDEEQAVASRYGWSGELKETPGDSLALIEANVAGQKTDGVINESVNVNVDVQADGSVVDTVTLTRTHTGSKGELFRGVRNVSYLRAYVPKGSQLVTASGFEPPPEKLFKKPDDDYVPDPDLAALESHAGLGAGGVAVGEEGSRTVFGGWLQLDPGETQTITYTYRLPFRVTDLYRKIEASPEDADSARAAYLMLLTSQSGKIDREITTNVNFPASWKVAWSRGLSETPAKLTREGVWDRDQVVAALLVPPGAQE
ncbi:MAG: DUF4012 domain-containing protein [Patescibacteria group bacterium]|jgi:hypothetical protein